MTPWPPRRRPYYYHNSSSCLLVLLCSIITPSLAFWGLQCRPVAPIPLPLTILTPHAEAVPAAERTYSYSPSKGRPPHSSNKGHQRASPSPPRSGGSSSSYDDDHVRMVTQALEKELQEVRDGTLSGWNPIETEDDGDVLVGGGVADLINMVRSMAEPQRQFYIDRACRLFSTPVLDVATVRVMFKALSQQTDGYELALQLVQSMRQHCIWPDAYVAGLVGKMQEEQPEWGLVLEALQQLLLESTARGEKPENVRRHQGYSYSLISAVRRGNVYAAGYLMDALLAVGMVDLATAKMALRVFTYQKRASHAIKWIQVVRAIGLPPDAALYLDMMRLYRQLQKPKQTVDVLEEAYQVVEEADFQAFALKQLTVAVQACQDTGDVEELQRCLALAEQRGVELDEFTYGVALQSFYEQGQIASAATLVDRQEAAGRPLTLKIARQVALSMSRARQLSYDVILSFIRTFMVEREVQPDAACYTAVIQRLARHGDPDKALEVFDMMKKDGIEPTTVTCGAILMVFAASERYQEGLAFFDGLPNMGIDLDVKSFTQVFRILEGAQRWDLMGKYLDLAVSYQQTKGMELDQQFFATVIDVCAEANRTNDALTALATAERRGPSPNIFCYTSAAKACIRGGRLDRALSLLAKVTTKGPKPDNLFWRTIFLGCCQFRVWPTAVLVYRKMISSDVFLEEGILQLVVDQASKANQLEFATEIIDEMRRRNLRPNNATVASYLKAWYSKGEYEKGWQHLPPNITLSSSVYQAVMYELLQQHQWGQILKLEKAMQASGVPTNALIAIDVLVALAELGDWDMVMKRLPDLQRHTVVTYGNLLDCCARQIEPNRALALLDRMKVEGVKPDGACYHSVLDACSQAGMKEEVWSIFNEMTNANLKDGIRLESFGIVLELCAREGRCDAAITIMDKLEAQGVPLDLTCTSAAMIACRDAMRGRAPTSIPADKLRERMGRWREQETTLTYNTELCVLVCPPGLSKKGVSATSMRILKEMKSNGVPMNTDTYNMVLESLSHDGDLEGAKALLQEMRGSSTCEPNLFTFLTMATFTCRESQLREALSYLEEAMTMGVKQREPLAVIWRRYSYYISLWPRTLKNLSWTVAKLASDPALPRIGPIFKVLATALPPDVVNLPGIAQSLVQAGMKREDIEGVTGVKMEMPAKGNMNMPDSWVKDLGALSIYKPSTPPEKQPVEN